MFFSLAECPSCASFDRSHDRRVTILKFWPYIGPHMVKKKEHLEPKWALLGPLADRKRLDTRPKCEITMTSTQSDQLTAVGAKSGPWGAPKRGILGQNGPFWGPLGPRGDPIPGQSVW